MLQGVREVQVFLFKGRVPLTLRMVVQSEIEMWNPKYKPRHIYY